MSMGFILGWAEDRSSAILKLDLQSLQVTKLLTENHEIHKFMVCDTHLFYGTFLGSVHIFRIPSLEKVGLISYNNEILDIVYMENTTSNMITFKNVLILEACKKEIKDERSKGSFSIFRIE
jgi:hypothetical protein